MFKALAYNYTKEDTLKIPPRTIIGYLNKVAKKGEEHLSVFLASETKSKPVHQITPEPAISKTAPKATPQTTEDPDSQTKKTQETGILEFNSPQGYPLTMDIGHPKLSAETLEKMKALILKYKQVFASEAVEVQTVKDFKFKIQLTDEKIIAQKPYPMNPEKRRHAHKLVDDMLESGLVRITGSPYNHPVVMVKKPNADPNGNDTYRLTVNLKKFNDQIKDTKFSLPLVDDVLSNLHGAKIFSSLDVKMAYHQISLDEESQWLLAFQIDGRPKVCFQTLPMGLKNSSAAYLRLMSMMFSDLQYCTVNVFVDDLIIFSNNEQKHLQDLEEVLEGFAERNMMLNGKKALIAKTQVPFVGFLVGTDGIKLMPKKVEIIRNLKAPNDKK